VDVDELRARAVLLEVVARTEVHGRRRAMVNSPGKTRRQRSARAGGDGDEEEVTTEQIPVSNGDGEGRRWPAMVSRGG
jgi:hypothetical protein